MALAPTPDPLFTRTEPDHPLSRPSPALPDVFPTDRPLVTHETTFTYFTTRFLRDSTTVLTRKETITNYEIDTLVKPTRPLIVTRTVVRAPDSTQTLTLVTKRPQIGEGSEVHELQPVPDLTPSLLIEPHDPHDPHSSPVPSPLPPDHHHHPITPTPVTYYTTFTYFTTELEQGHPVIHSREQVISTVIRGKVLPTRVRSVPRALRSKRHALLSNGINSDHSDPQSDRTVMLEVASIPDPIPSAVHGKHFFFKQQKQPGYRVALA